MASTIEQSIEVEVPIATAYNQWTQFEEFPRFMEGVEEVRQLDDKRLHWKATVGGKTNLGSETTAHIRTGTLLGQRVLTLEPAGSERMRSSDVQKPPGIACLDGLSMSTALRTWSRALSREPVYISTSFRRNTISPQRG